jgi:two-component system cell cycle sensor histidine kinase/response regulator CckA
MAKQEADGVGKGPREVGDEVAAELRRALEIARESERRFGILSELSNDYCYVARQAGETLTVEWLTGAFARITGYDPEELLERGLWSIVHPDDRESVERELNRVRAQVTPSGSRDSRSATSAQHPRETVVHEFRILTKSGKERWLREHLLAEQQSDESLLIYGAAREVTDRHRARAEQENLEAQLRQSQKMDAIGRLAGGVAHDFNNLLTVILTHCGFLLADLPQRTQHHDDASDIQGAARRAAELTQRLLAFSRQQVLTPIVIDLNSVLRDLESMLISLLGEGIELEIMLHPGAVRLKADRAQLEQIVLNLVVNARDAMPQGGKLQIVTAQVNLGPDYVRTHPEASEGMHVALGVRDTGIGMGDHVLARIFEPFFTTKEQGKGTGLGLSTVYGIVKQSGGSIHVESRVGFGSTFEVFFPLVNEPERREASVRPAEARPARQETILVVEDEEGVRRGVQRILRHAGYQVLVAADPAQALSIIADYGGHVDMLLTDVVMPMMTGVQLAERVVAMRNDIKVLYMSGHAREGLDSAYKNRESIEFLQKPFTREAMLNKVAHVLDSE